MAVYKAKDLARIFANYKPDDDIVITWWDKADVEEYCDDTLEPSVLWEAVCEQASDSLEWYISSVNDFIRIEVNEFLDDDGDDIEEEE